MTVFAEPKARAGRVASILDLVLDGIVAIYRASPVAFGILIFLCYLSVVALVAVVQPQVDWDVLPYLAIAAEHRLDGAAAVHAYAYGVVEANVKPAAFILLTDDAGGYRSHMFADPAAFASMFGMYRVKWLYIEAVRLLGGIVDPLLAIRIVSGVSAIAVAGVAIAWLKSEKALVLAPVLAALLALSGFADMARAVTPDTLFAAALLAGLYAQARRLEAATFVLLLLAFLIRPDNLIFLGVYAVLMLVYRQRGWGVLAAFAISALLFVPVTRITGQPGWWEQLYFASVERQMTLDGFHPAFSLAAYLTAVVKQFLLAVTAQSWVALLTLALAAWFFVSRFGQAPHGPARVMMLALLSGIAAKFVLVPIFDTRIYFPYLLAMLLVLSGNIVRAVSRERAPQ